MKIEKLPPPPPISEYSVTFTEQELENLYSVLGCICGNFPEQCTVANLYNAISKAVSHKTLNGGKFCTMELTLRKT